MDQPTYTPTQKIIEATGTLYFKFGDLDATKQAGGIKIRVQTIAHYVEKYSRDLIKKKTLLVAGELPALSDSV